MSKALEMARELVKMLEEKEAAKEQYCTNETKVLLYDVPAGEIIESGGNKYKVLEHFSEGISIIIPMKFMLKNIKFGNTRDYRQSNLKKQIEEKCISVFEKDFGKENIVEHDVSLISVDMQTDLDFFTAGVRPITFDEARKYNDLLVSEYLDDWWWTCTPWSTEKRGWKYSVAVVSPSGDIFGNDYFRSNGVRPVCILKSNIFVSKGE